MSKKNKVHDFDSWRKEVLSEVFDLAYGVYNWNISQLAAEAKLPSSTVRRLMNEQTLDPRSSTLFKLTKAVGLWMSVIQEIQQKHSGRKAA